MQHIFWRHKGFLIACFLKKRNYSSFSSCFDNLSTLPSVLFWDGCARFLICCTHKSGNSSHRSFFVLTGRLRKELNLPSPIMCCCSPLKDAFLKCGEEEHRTRKIIVPNSPEVHGGKHWLYPKLDINEWSYQGMAWKHLTSKEISQNHKMFVLEGILPCHGQGHPPLDQVAQSPIQSGIGPFQAWGIHNFSAQPVPVPQHAHNEQLPPNI